MRIFENGVYKDVEPVEANQGEPIFWVNQETSVVERIAILEDAFAELCMEVFADD